MQVPDQINQLTQALTNRIGSRFGNAPAQGMQISSAQNAIQKPPKPQPRQPSAPSGEFGNYGGTRGNVQDAGRPTTGQRLDERLSQLRGGRR